MTAGKIEGRVKERRTRREREVWTQEHVFSRWGWKWKPPGLNSHVTCPMKRPLALKSCNAGRWIYLPLKNVESIQIVEPQKAVNVRSTHNCLGTVHLALDNMCLAIKLNCSICSTQTLNVNTPHVMPKVLRLALNHLYLMFSQSCSCINVCTRVSCE